MSCVVVGDAAITLRCAEILRERGHRVLGVVTGDARIAGWCAERKIPCRFAGPGVPLRREEVLALTGGEPFDLLFSLHNLRIVPADLLALPRRMAINYHDALLPRYGGLHATTWALFHGETAHGITWHRMTPEVDAGEILAQREVAIPPDAGAWTLNGACTEAALASFPGLLAGLEAGTLVPRPQSAAGRSWFPGWRKPAPGCVIPWDAAAEQASAFVRCLDFGAADNPLGVPKLLAPGGVLLVRSLEILERRSGEPAGSVLAAGAEGIVVATATRDVRIPWDAEAEHLGLARGVRLAAAAPEGERLAARERALRRHEGFWTAVLEDLAPLAPPGFRADGEGLPESLAFQVPAGTLHRLAALGPVQDALPGAVLAWLGLAVGEPFDVAFGEPALRGEIVAAGWDRLLATRPPLRVAAGGAASLRAFLEALDGERARRRALDTYPLDLPARVRRLRARPESAPAVAVDLLAAGEEPPGLDPATALAVAVGADGRLTWRARTGDPGRLAGFVDRFADWLAATAEAPDRLLSDAPEPWPATVDERFRAQAARRPDAAAVEADGEVWTYGRLAARAARLAAALRRRGVGPERLVALRLARLADLATGLLGTLAAGGAFLVLDPREPPERQARLLAAARPWLLLAGDPTGLPRLAPDLPVHPIALADAPEGPESGPCDPGPRNRLAYVAFTSGSTGAPKGVAVEHPALARYLAAAGEQFGLAAGDRLLQLGSPAFDLAYEQIFGALCHGATLVGLGGAGLPGSAELLAACARSRVTVLDLPTAVWAQLSRDVAERALPLPASLRLTVIGGEAARRASAEEWRRAAPGARLLNTYGPTEATIVAAWWEAPLAGDLPAGDAAGDTLPIGRPVAGVEAHVLDGDRRPVRDGEAGELWLGGTGLARGYHRRPEATAERFVSLEIAGLAGSRRLYRTGDRVRRRADGELEFLGRLDRQVKIAGHRVEPGEVEAALRGMAGVADAAVALTPGGARLQAWLVLEKDARDGLDRLRAEAARTLPAWLRPSRFTAVTALPRNRAGKLDLGALREIPAVGAAAPAIPREPVEAALAGLWEKVLGAGRVESGDDFFALGGDSLTALALLGEIERAFGRRVPVARLLAASTLAALAAEIRTPAAAEARTPGARPSCLVPLHSLQTAGGAPPFVCVHGLGGHLLRLVPLARAFAPHRAFLGLQSPGLDDDEPAPESLEELARIFLAAVRRELGEGPLHLGGMSFGGLVAFEMARQAVAAGIAVPFLALLDTDLSEVLPGRRPPPPPPYARALGALRRFVGDRLGRTRRRLRRLRSGRDAVAKPNEYQGFTRVLHANEAALARYRPGPYAGRVTYFQASPWPPAVFPEFAALTGCDLAIVPVPGGHLSQLEPPHVGTLAAELLARLEGEGGFRPAADRPEGAAGSRAGPAPGPGRR